MRALWIKLILFLVVWYEVTAELGLSGGTALVVALLVCGFGMMLLRLPLQILSVLGPRGIIVAGPVVVWLALAWWLAPNKVMAFPVFTLAIGAQLALLGGAARYAVTRYPAWFARHMPMLRGAISPVGSILLGLSDQLPQGLLSLAALAVLIGMPVRLGWKFIPPLAAHKFDAKMGDADGFRRAGFRDEA